jgi:hypothetical protein
MDKHEVFEDSPWHDIYREIDEHYDDVLFIYCERDPEEWLISLFFNAMRPGTPEARKAADISHSIQYNIPKYTTHHGKILLEKYKQHCIDVKEYFKDKDNFIEIPWWSEMNWEKLCKILDIKVIPEKPFPHRKRGSPYPKFEKLIKLSWEHPKEFYGY